MKESWTLSRDFFLKRPGKDIRVFRVDPPEHVQSPPIVRSGLLRLAIIVFRNEGAEALMALALQVVSSHLL
jgi:hypothetical protein